MMVDSWSNRIIAAALRLKTQRGGMRQAVFDQAGPLSRMQLA